LANDLIFGTLDTWMISQWTKSRTLVTDPTTACRTQLYDIGALKWSDELMAIFHLRPSFFSQVLPNDHFDIECDDGPFLHSPLPLLSSLCDQPAALIGHGGLEAEVLKISFGTGAFIDLSTKTCLKEEDLLTSVLYAAKSEASYYLEGGVLSFASAIEWMEKNFWLNKTEIFSALNQDLPIAVLPAFSGLGAPFFHAEQKTAITGVALEHTAKDIAVAGVQALVFRIVQIIEEMARHVPIPPQIEVDGGLSCADSLMQFLADVCQRQVIVRNHPQMTAEGVAKMILRKLGKPDEIYAHGSSRMIDVNNNFPARKYREWKEAFQRMRDWSASS
jgi:glycerol kinase